jgi:hypothetical protein
MKCGQWGADRADMLRTRTTIFLAVLTGVSLELGIHALSGRREAWDSAQYWTVGLPIVGLISVALGVLSQRSDWLWTFLIVPSQVMTMMMRSAEVGNLWPVALILAGILSTPFVVVSFVGSRFRPERKP